MIAPVHRYTRPMSASLVFPRPSLDWQLRDRTLRLGQRTFILGIVNCTPDSFSDGGSHATVDDAVRHGLALLDQGADVLDLGAESTRPGATPVSPTLEQQRLLPLFQQLRRLRPHALLSIDTYHASTARAALDYGADIINDVSGLQWDPDMTETLAGSSPHPGLILMHSRGTPATWAQLPALAPADVAEVVERELAQQLALAVQAGIPPGSIAVDPGFGFGKRGEENMSLLAQLATLHRANRPLVIGLSRKGFLTSPNVPASHHASGALSEERRQATIAGHTAAILAGAHLLRVHDIPAAIAAASIGDRLQLASAALHRE